MTSRRLLSYGWWSLGLPLIVAMARDLNEATEVGFPEDFWSVGPLSSWICALIVVCGTGVALRLPLIKAKRVASITVGIIILYVAYYQALTPPGQHLTLVSLYHVVLIVIGLTTLVVLWTTREVMGGRRSG